MDRKASVKKAIESYIKKDDKKYGPKRRNKSPEKDVEKEVMKWFKEQGFIMQVVEAKAKIDPDSGHYVTPAKSGTSDTLGVCPDGMGAFVELKAAGRRSTLSELQYDFLVERGRVGAFVACVDSVERLRTDYQRYQNGQDMIALLPKPKIKKDELDDDPEFGF